MWKKLLILLIVLAAGQVCAFPTHTNQQSFVVSNSVSSANSAFYWTWNDFDDQILDVEFDVGGSTNIMFVMARPRKGQKYLTASGGVVVDSGSSITYLASIARTNVPPPSVYNAAFLLYEASGGTVTASRVLATGKVKTEWSIFNISNSASWTPVAITYTIPTNISLTESDPIWASASNLYLPRGGYMVSNLNMASFDITNIGSLLFESGGSITESNYTLAGTNVVYVDDQGRLGVQTTNITHSLTVNGVISCTTVTGATYYGDGGGLTNLTGVSGALYTNSVFTGDVSGVWNSLEIQKDVVGSNELNNTFLNATYLGITDTNLLWTQITNNTALIVLSSNAGVSTLDFASATNYLNGKAVTNASDITTLSNHVNTIDTSLEGQVNALSNSAVQVEAFSTVTNALWVKINTNTANIAVNASDISTLQSDTNTYAGVVTGAVYLASYKVVTNALWTAIDNNTSWNTLSSNAWKAGDATNLAHLVNYSNTLYQTILDNTGTNETDPIWTAASSLYYQASQSDARYLTSSTGRFDSLTIADNSATGSEMVVNGVFTNAVGNWTLTGTASNNADRIQVGSGVGGIAPSNALTLVTGGVYYVTFAKGSEGLVTLHLGGDTKVFGTEYSGTNAVYMGASKTHSNLYVEIDGNGSWEYIDTLSIRKITNGTVYAGDVFGNFIGNVSVAESDPIWGSVSNAYWTSNTVAQRIKYQENILCAMTNSQTTIIATLVEDEFYMPGGVTWDSGLKFDATINDCTYTSTTAFVPGFMYKFLISVDNAISNRDMVVSVGGNTNTYYDISNGTHTVYIGANTTNAMTLGCKAGATGWRIGEIEVYALTNGDAYVARNMTVGGDFSAGYYRGDGGGLTNLVEYDPLWTNALASGFYSPATVAVEILTASNYITVGNGDSTFNGHIDCDTIDAEGNITSDGYIVADYFLDNSARVATTAEIYTAIGAWSGSFLADGTNYFVTNGLICTHD